MPDQSSASAPRIDGHARVRARLDQKEATAGESTRALGLPTEATSRVLPTVYGAKRRSAGRWARSQRIARSYWSTIGASLMAIVATSLGLAVSGIAVWVMLAVTALCLLYAVGAYTNERDAAELTEG